MKALARNWQGFDLEERQRDLVQVRDGLAHVHLAIDGMRCGACALAVERAVGGLEGVQRVDVNAATRRAAITWDPARRKLSELLAAIASLEFEPRFPDADVDGRRIHERRTAYKRLAVAGFMMMQVMSLAFGLYAGPDMEEAYRLYFRLTSMLLTVPVVFYSAVPFFRGAWSGLRARRLGMDLPVSAAILIAFAASIHNTLRDSGEVYFDSVTMFVFFLLLGRLVEMSTRHDAGTITKALARLLPGTAIRMHEGAAQEVDSQTLRPGDSVRVPAGAIVPADGFVVAGASRVDESMLTGEATPVRKGIGGKLLAGSLNVGQPLTMSVTALGGGTVLSSVVRLLERAQTQKPGIARVADRTAAHFVGWILAITVLVGAGWYIVDPRAALPAVLAVLVVTCPCALSLATPAAIAAVTNRLAQLGLLITNADAIEALAGIRTCVLDKTGTLTAGAPRLRHTIALGAEPAERCLELAAALERHSEHPLSAAFLAADTGALEALEVKVTAGQGVAGTIGEREYSIGAGEFVASVTRAPVPRDVPPESIFLGAAGEWIAAFEIDDALRPGVATAVTQLRELGIEVHIASGDHQAAVERTARRAGVAHWHARQSPADKLELVAALEHRGGVLMVGDGINDAPVLGRASVSAAMGTGTALAQASADLIVANDSPGALVTAVREARRTLRIVRQNLAWAFAYNLACVPLAALGFIPPWAAAVGMSASSIVVVLNARRLSRPARACRYPIIWPVCCC